MVDSLACTLLRKYNTTLRKDVGLMGDLLMYRVLIPNDTDISKLLLESCTCDDSTTCCTPAELSNIDVDDIATVITTNRGKTVDFTDGSTDWFALAIPTMNDEQRAAVRKAVDDSIAKVRPDIRKRVSQIGSKEEATLVQTGDIDKQFTDAYSDVYEAASDALAKLLQLSFTGPRLDIMQSTIMRTLRLGVAERWLRAVHEECTGTQLEAKQPVLFDLLQLTHVMFMYDIASLLVGWQPVYDETLSAVIKPLPLNYDEYVDDVSDLSARMQSKWKDHNMEATDFADENDRLTQIQATLQTHSDKYRNEAAAVRNATLLELRLTVAMMCACVVFTMYSAWAARTDLDWPVVALVGVAYVALIFSECMSLLRKK